MNSRKHFSIILIALLMSAFTFSQNDKKDVLKIVNTFFRTMQTKDSVAFNNLFLNNAYAYSVRQKADSVIVRNSILKASSSKSTLKERLREEEITIHLNKRVAAVWAPYDFWINDKHSHCGYEVFTLIKKDTVWKIASLTYSVEENGCGFKN